MTTLNDNTQPYEYDAPTNHLDAAKPRFALSAKAKVALAGVGIAIASISSTAAVMAAVIPSAQLQSFERNRDFGQHQFNRPDPNAGQVQQQVNPPKGTSEQGRGSTSSGSQGSATVPGNTNGMPQPPQNDFGQLQPGQGQMPSFGNQSNASQRG